MGSSIVSISREEAIDALTLEEQPSDAEDAPIVGKSPEEESDTPSVEEAIGGEISPPTVGMGDTPLLNEDEK
jgi:hypothetical protein